MTFAPRTETLKNLKKTKRLSGNSSQTAKTFTLPLSSNSASEEGQRCRRLRVEGSNEEEAKNEGRFFAALSSSPIKRGFQVKKYRKTRKMQQFLALDFVVPHRRASWRTEGLRWEFLRIFDGSCFHFFSGPCTRLFSNSRLINFLCRSRSTRLPFQKKNALRCTLALLVAPALLQISVFNVDRRVRGWGGGESPPF